VAVAQSVVEQQAPEEPAAAAMDRRLVQPQAVPELSTPDLAVAVQATA